MSFTADQVFDTGDHEPVSIASTSMIEHVAIPAINQTFDAIGKTPLDPKRVKLKSYGERKLRQLQAGVRETLQMNKPKGDVTSFINRAVTARFFADAYFLTWQLIGRFS